MDRTVFAGRFVFSPATMVETSRGEVCQPLVFFRHLLGVQLVSAVEFYHSPDNLFLTFYLVHKDYKIKA